VLTFHELILRSRAPIAEEAYALTFEIPCELRQDYRFRPGQHIVVRATVNDRSLRRNYSIVDPFGFATDAGLITIGVRVQGEMSRYLARELGVNERLQVMPPGGSFNPELHPTHSKRYVAVAAGSGITPIISIVGSILRIEPRSDVILFYGNRSLARAMFIEEIMALKNRYPSRLTLNFIMSREPQEFALFNGRLSADKLLDFPETVLKPGAADEYFLCGPQGLIDGLLSDFRSHGVTGLIHLERFGLARKDSRSSDVDDLELIQTDSLGINSNPELLSETPMTQVTVIMNGRRRSFNMRRDQESLLEAAEIAGLELPFACRAGVCSTCRARVLSGSATMNYNQALVESEVAAGDILCCQARPTSAFIEVDCDAR
jgi:ring-1,2-phenylacetyl-CoA epoxidase subunit PaaE